MPNPSNVLGFLHFTDRNSIYFTNIVFYIFLNHIYNINDNIYIKLIIKSNIHKTSPLWGTSDMEHIHFYLHTYLLKQKINNLK